MADRRPPPYYWQVARKVLEAQPLPGARDDDPEALRGRRVLAAVLVQLGADPAIRRLFAVWWQAGSMESATREFGAHLADAGALVGAPLTQLIRQDPYETALSKRRRQALMRRGERWAVSVLRSPAWPQDWKSPVLRSLIQKQFTGIAIARVVGGHSSVTLGAVPAGSGRGAACVDHRRRPRRVSAERGGYIERDVHWYLEHRRGVTILHLARAYSGTRAAEPSDQPGRKTVEKAIRRIEQTLARMNFSLPTGLLSGDSTRQQ